MCVHQVSARCNFEEPSPLVKSRFFQDRLDDNNLPDIYNAITYFKKSDTAERFYGIVRDVFENWEEYKAILKSPVS